MTYLEPDPEDLELFFQYPVDPSTGLRLSRWPAAGGRLVRLDPPGMAAFLNTLEAFMERNTVPYLTDLNCGTLDPSRKHTVRGSDLEPVTLELSAPWGSFQSQRCIVREVGVGSGAARTDLSGLPVRDLLTFDYYYEFDGRLRPASRCGDPTPWIKLLSGVTAMFFGSWDSGTRSQVLYVPDPLNDYDSDDGDDPPPSYHVPMLLYSPDPYTYGSGLFGGTPKSSSEVEVPLFHGTGDFAWDPDMGPSPWLVPDASDPVPTLSEQYEVERIASENGQPPSDWFADHGSDVPSRFPSFMRGPLLELAGRDSVRNWFRRVDVRNPRTHDQAGAGIPTGPRRSWCGYGVLQTMMGMMNYTGAVIPVGLHFRVSESVRTRSWTLFCPAETPPETGWWGSLASRRTIGGDIFYARPSSIGSAGGPERGCDDAETDVDDVEEASGGRERTTSVEFSRGHSLEFPGTSPDRPGHWEPAAEVYIPDQYTTGLRPSVRTLDELEEYFGDPDSDEAWVPISDLFDEFDSDPYQGVLPCLVNAVGPAPVASEVFRCRNTVAATPFPAERAAQHVYPCRRFAGYVGDVALTTYDWFDDGIAELSWRTGLGARTPGGVKALFNSVDVPWPGEGGAGGCEFGAAVVAHNSWLLGGRCGLESVTRPDDVGVPEVDDGWLPDAWNDYLKSGWLVYSRSRSVRAHDAPVSSAPVVKYFPHRAVFPSGDARTAEFVFGYANVLTAAPVVHDSGRAVDSENGLAIRGSAVLSANPLFFDYSSGMFEDEVHTFAENFTHRYSRAVASVGWRWKAMPVSAGQQEESST